MGAFIDLIGQKFGRLTPIKNMGTNKNKKHIWLCLCDCGKETIVIGNNIKNGRTKSCGCLNITKTKLRNIENKYAKTHGYCQTTVYRSWHDILQRCTNPNNNNYKNYGGRGIAVCDRWNSKKGGSFENFLEDMGEPPTNKHQIDRINNNLGYYKENCWWAISAQQHRNMRSNRNYTFNGKTQCRNDWAREYGIGDRTLAYRLDKLKWSIRKALLTPARKIK
jgi:hypothetical protein